MEKRVVLVTGASSGIGEEIAKQLVHQGDYPVLVARRRKKLEGVQSRLAGECALFACDISQPEQVKQLIQQVIVQLGKVDVLVNSAGYGHFRGAQETEYKDYLGMMQTNYLGAVYLTCELLPHMLKQGKGRVIYIASIAGLTGIPNLAGYCASKFALLGFAESVQLEYEPVIRVGVLCPGPVQTPFFQEKEVFQVFPSSISKQVLDVKTVAQYALRLIERPRHQIIPKRLHWAIRFRRLFPHGYRWVTKKMYDSFRQKQ